MKVFDLTCAGGHRFEGWFASADQFGAQCRSGTMRCPLCDSDDVQRAPSAPRLHLGGEQRAAAPEPDSTASPPAVTAANVAAAQAALVRHVRRLVAATEDVGARFAEEARRIHYEEVPVRAIRGTASERERRDLEDEGIETLTLVVPAALTETLQ